MAEFIEITKAWFFSLGEQYGVNPIIFGGIYVGAIPFFTASLAWLYRNYKLEKSVILPVVCATFFFISSYLYLIVVGKNVPWWVYMAVVLMLAYGAFTTYRKVSRKLNRMDEGVAGDGKT